MSYDVHWQISFEAGEPKEVCPIAGKHLDILYKREMDVELEGKPIPHEVGWFLNAVFNEKAYFSGNKGDLWLFGTIGNYLDTEKALPHLLPFFRDLWLSGIMMEEYRVIIFQEDEQRRFVEIWTLLWDEAKKEIKVEKQHNDFKWCWGQW